MPIRINNIDSLSFEEICQTISNIYNNNINIELEDLEKLFIRFIELLFMRIFNINRPPIVEIVDSKEFVGKYNGYFKFKINRLLIKKFQEGKAFGLFETIAHELKHHAQRKDYEKINIKNSIIEKDNYSKENIKDYYDDNEDIVMVEIDANLSQADDAIDILNALNITPSTEELAIAKKAKEFYLQLGIITKRFVNGEIREIDDIFDDLLLQNTSKMDDFDKVNFLEFKPCANIGI